MTPDRAPSGEPLHPSSRSVGGPPPPSHAGPPYPPPGVQGHGCPGPGQPPPGPYPGHGQPAQSAQSAPQRTGYLRVVLATAVWGAVLVVLGMVVAGRALSPEGAGYLVGSAILPVLLGSLITWLVVRRRAMAFWVLVLAAAPAFWLLRLVASAARLSGRA